MKRLILFIATLAIMAMVLPLCQAQKMTDDWKNYGYCASADTWDANALSSTRLKWASLKTEFTTLSDPNNHVLWIPVPEWAEIINLRYRGSAVTTAGTVELTGVTGAGDAEYICYQTLSADASAMPATALVDGNDISKTIKSSGYYFGNVTDSNDSDFATSIIQQNCGSTHRMCATSFYVGSFNAVIVHPTSVTNGTIYWDACFEGETK